MASNSFVQAADASFALSLAFKGVNFILRESVPEEITVTSTGIGDNQQSAIRNSLNISVQKAVGVLVISEQSVSNDKVIRNLSAEYSSGVVNSYEVKKCEGKPVSCEVTAKVSPWKFMRKLQGESQTIQVNGDDLFMQHQTAKSAMLQRYKIANYYMSQIRQSGLDVVINSVNVEPNTGDLVKLSVEYEVKWNKDFKKEIIRFLERLEKDTVNNDNNNQVYIQWNSTGFFENRVRINTHDNEFRRMMEYYIYKPTMISFNELGVCEDAETKDVFTVDWYGAKRKKTFLVAPEKLKNIRSLSVSLGCGKV